MGAIIACYFLFQGLLHIPNDVLSYFILAWGACVFLDLHSTLRTPSMMQHETNQLFAFLHGKVSWGSVPLQLSVEVGILGAISLFTVHPFQTFSLACACTGVLHAWCWRKNEIFRQKINPEEFTKRNKK